MSGVKWQVNEALVEYYDDGFDFSRFTDFFGRKLEWPYNLGLKIWWKLWKEEKPE